MPLVVASNIVAAIVVALSLFHVYWTLISSPLAKFPGPKSFSLTRLRLSREDFQGTRTRTIHRLHQQYGAAVRVGPNEVSFNSLRALRQIYGAGSPFGRPPSFYRIFSMFGQTSLFTLYSSSDHATRKKMMSQMYSKSAVLKSPVADSIRSKAQQFLDLIESDPRTASDLVRSLHFFSLDNMTWMVFGAHGATKALMGKSLDRQILSDIDEPTARRYSWFQVHLAHYTRFVMSCSSSQLRSIIDVLGLLPGKLPLAYSGLQDFALATFNTHRPDKISVPPPASESSLMMRLLHGKNENSRGNPLSDMEVAAECADNLDAGLKTTSDTLMFALWVLSLPQHRKHQERLIEEVKDAKSFLAGDASILPADACDRLPFLDALIKETLRLYAPIPASQPRISTQDTTIDGYHIPAGTVVSCQAFSMHRNPDVFPHPKTFNPDRWLASDAETAEMKRWWWPFSSGARMCLGMQ
jgi:cytochrome P450